MAGPRPKGWWYPWIFVGGMAVVIVVNIVFITAAVGTFPGLETTDHYRKGLAYNKDLAAEQAQERRGWQMQFQFQPEGASDSAHRGRLAVQFTDAAGGPLAHLDVRADLVRPTRQGYDQALTLSTLGNGRYGGEVALPLPGQWEVRILARDGDQHFQATRRLLVP